MEKRNIVTSGNKDVDLEIFLELSDSDLIALCRTSKEMDEYICGNDLFWELRTKMLYKDEMKLMPKQKRQSWKNYYEVLRKKPHIWGPFDIDKSKGSNVIFFGSSGSVFTGPPPNMKAIDMAEIFKNKYYNPKIGDIVLLQGKNITEYQIIVELTKEKPELFSPFPYIRLNGTTILRKSSRNVLLIEFNIPLIYKLGLNYYNLFFADLIQVFIKYLLKLN